MLRDQNILLGVTGSIAAYKSVDLARRLIDEGARVKVVMTDAACRFVTPYLFETVTGSPVHTDLFKDPFSHLALSRDAGLFIIAPATANTINKLSCGIADNMLSNLWLSFSGPVVMAPAMNFRMYNHRTVKRSIKELQKAGTQFIGPETGSLACGEEGEGRMADVPDIVEAASTALSKKDLRGHHIMVTAGPTVEPLDPVRYFSNRSSGRMGYAIARAALRRGAGVILISGPSSLTPPMGASFIPVERASDMEEAVLQNLDKVSAVIMSAAVCDYSPVDVSNVKLKKTDSITLKLKRNKDILAEIGRKKKKKILIGFAAESGKNVKSAMSKREEKNLDLIVLNDISREGAGFNVDTNIVTLIDSRGGIREYPKMSKIDVAHIILDRIPEIKRVEK